jgi:uncharacterized protein
MRSEDLRIAREFKERLARAVPLVDVRLYGSRARGDSEPDSDMDVFVEVEEISSRVKDVIEDVAWELGLDHLMHISPLIFSRYELENSPLRSSPVVQNIAREGVAV